MPKQPKYPDINDDDVSVGFKGMCKFFHVSSPTGWRMVKEKVVPPPFYPRPRSPRWTLGELRATRDNMRRMLPSEAKAAHRAAKLRQPDVTA